MEPSTSHFLVLGASLEVSLFKGHLWLKHQGDEEISCEGKAYSTKSVLKCEFHQLAYQTECELQANDAEAVIHPELGRGQSNLCEAHFTVLPHFRAKDQSLCRYVHVNNSLAQFIEDFSENSLLVMVTFCIDYYWLWLVLLVVLFHVLQHFCHLTLDNSHFLQNILSSNIITIIKLYVLLLLLLLLLLLSSSSL